MSDGSARATDVVELVAGESDEGRRLDDFLATALALGRRAAVRLLDRALLNGGPARKGQRMRAGDVVRVPCDAAPGAASHEAPEVVRATPGVLVLAKPAGLPSIALAGSAGDSLAARIAGHFPECAGVGRPGESGLAHRLDTGTSGLLLAARDARAYHALRAQFRARTVEKQYLALVAGALARPVQIETPIGQHRGSRRRMRAVAADAARERYALRPASTHAAPERVLDGATLVRATTTSGARHQIRVHLASIGHPLLGDPLYGDGRTLPEASAAAPDGFLLHACRIAWRDPVTDAATEDEISPPETWTAVLASLGAGPRRAR